METEFHGYRIMAHARPKIHREHNNRTPYIVNAKHHIDSSRLHENILDMGNLNECYEQIFGEAVKDYNAKQKRKDRRIINYLETLKNDRRKGKHRDIKTDGSRKPAYEFIFQIGNRDNRCDEQQAIKVLKLFAEKWMPQHYPNIKPIGMYLHDDEFSIDEKTGNRMYSPPHIHFDWIPIAHGLTPEELEEEKSRRMVEKRKSKTLWENKGKIWTSKEEKAWQKTDWQEVLVKRYGKALSTGMQLQSSLSAGLLEMGFKTGRGKGTAQQQFEEAVRHDLQDVAESMGIKVDRTPAPKHPHYEKDEYQVKKDNERKSMELDNRESHIAQNEEGIRSNERNLALRENEIDYLEKKYTEKSHLVDSYDTICSEVSNRSLSINKAEKRFHEDKDRVPFNERLKTFVTDTKKIVVDLVTELDKYKQAFHMFWKATANDFRNLANSMDRNGCGTFEKFHHKRMHGMLKNQVEQKNKNYREYNEQKKRIDNYYDMEY